MGTVAVDPCGTAEAAAEGAYLVTFSYDDLKADDNKKTTVELSCYLDHTEDKDT